MNNVVKYRFKKYVITHNHKQYVVMVPMNVENCLWIVDWADWWYGTFIDSSVRGIKLLNACFAYMGFNPHVIMYLPVKDCLIPRYLTPNPENGRSDIVFMTEQSRVRGSTWVEIRKKLRKAKPVSTNVFKYDIERIKYYFKDKVKALDTVPYGVYTNKAKSDCWLFADTAFFSYPTLLYQWNCIDIHNCFSEVFERNDYRYNYHEKDDYWVCNDFVYFSWCARAKAKFSNEKPPLTLIIELYDYKIANRYTKKQDYLVSPDDREEEPFRNESYFKIKVK